MAPVSSSAWAPDKVTDPSPDVALFYKVTILVQHADGSLEEFYAAPETAYAFLDQLPAGDKLVFVDAPQSSMGREPPTGEP
jgi:hypothetical protein